RFRVNLMVQKQFFDKKLSCRIYVNDLFNTLQYDAKRPFEEFTTFRNDQWRSRHLRLWVSYNFSSINKVKVRKNKSKNEARRRL
ncbi:MAG: outer membrane beta-barrel protein, partial [Bacteroidota bacterium]